MLEKVWEVRVSQGSRASPVPLAAVLRSGRSLVGFCWSGSHSDQLACCLGSARRQGRPTLDLERR